MSGQVKVGFPYSFCDISTTPEVLNFGYTRVPKRKNKSELRASNSGRPRTRKRFVNSDGEQHLGSALKTIRQAPFPGPTGEKGLPLRVLPIGGLGEIGMNCMLVGVYDRYILIDAGLMFPDFQEYGMQKILPDTSFISQWKHKIEAVVITHGHEDHIGAMPWVLPALDPSTPVYASGFVMQLLEYKLSQFNLWDPRRFKKFDVKHRYKAGPFEMEPIRVTHSIPDCCGLILRSDHGTIVHTGDWKIDEDPVDGVMFDREALETIGKEGVTLLMSDSTNVLSPGRTVSESVVRKSLVEKVESWNGKGRVISTMFASNLHRLGSVKAAADATSRRICCIGMSLTAYLEAAQKSGDAPFDPRDLIHPSNLKDIDPNEVLVITTGSQGEDFAAMNFASNSRHKDLKFSSEDLLLYSAKMIPGNEKKVTKMMNRIAKKGTKIAMGRGELLHTSGHGYRDELAEAIKLVKPQHFLPVHGESVFLGAHAELAKELGVDRTMVIHDGEMLGVKPLLRRRAVSSGSFSSMKVLDQTEFTRFYNDGLNGTGTGSEMALYERGVMAHEGMIVVSLDIHRPPNLSNLLAQKDPNLKPTLRASVKVTTRGMWTNNGEFVEMMSKTVKTAVSESSFDSSCNAIEWIVRGVVKKASKRYNNRRPEVLVIAHEHDPRAESALLAAKNQRDAKVQGGRTSGPKMWGRRTFARSLENQDRNAQLSKENPEKQGKTVIRRRSTPPGSRRSRTFGKKPITSEQSNDKTARSKKDSVNMQTNSNGEKKDKGAEATNGKENGAGELVPVPKHILKKRQEKNPREDPQPGADVDYG